MKVVCNSTPLIALAKINQLRVRKNFITQHPPAQADGRARARVTPMERRLAGIE